MKQSDLLFAVCRPRWLIGMAIVIAAQAVAFELPRLGDHAAGVLSAKEEYDLGRMYLKTLHRGVPMIHDAALKDYLEQLTFRLAAFSQLHDYRLVALIINNNTINAFAAPGGLVGVNTGLLLHAQTESQFAAVIAHELAHLSQRHYARSVEEARQKSLPTIAAVLASVVLTATAGANVGAAALTSTVAGLHSARLRFSRQYEREADSTGMQTLVRAGFHPQALPAVFTQMHKAQRYSQRPPEFLSTHPVTANRIADAQALADQLGSEGSKDSLSYQLMKMRVLVLTTDDPAGVVKQLATGLTGVSEASRYGLALAGIATRDFTTAKQQLALLQKQAPGNVYYLMAQAQLAAESGHPDQGLQRINQALTLRPRYYPLLAAQVDLLRAQKQFKAARDSLLTLSRMRPEDPDIWYQLAEAQGQANDILGLHQARARFFLLTGYFDEAIQQIQYAQKRVGGNDALREKLAKQLADLRIYRQQFNKQVAKLLPIKANKKARSAP